VRRVTDDDHRPSVPRRYGGKVVRVVRGKLQRAGGDDPGGRTAVAVKEVDQVPLPLLGRGALSFGAAHFAAGDVGEPDDPATGVDDVAKERPRAEHHVPDAGFDGLGEGARVSTEVDQTDVAAGRRVPVNDCAGDRVDAVAADEQIRGGLRAILKPGDDAATRGGLGVHDPLAELERDAPHGPLFAQGLVGELA